MVRGRGLHLGCGCVSDGAASPAGLLPRALLLCHYLCPLVRESQGPQACGLWLGPSKHFGVCCPVSASLVPLNLGTWEVRG